MGLRAITLALFLLVSVPSTRSVAGQDKTAAALIACDPRTYGAALDCLEKYLPPDIQTTLAKPGGAVEAHFGLGVWIRNNWGLWQQGPLYRAMAAYGFSSPDDMSGAILEGFAARKRGQPFDVATKAAEYAEEGKKMWDQAVKEGRAGSLYCPMPTDPNDKQFQKKMDAALNACADQLKKSEPK